MTHRHSPRKPPVPITQPVASTFRWTLPPAAPGAAPHGFQGAGFSSQSLLRVLSLHFPNLSPFSTLAPRANSPAAISFRPSCLTCVISNRLPPPQPTLTPSFSTKIFPGSPSAPSPEGFPRKWHICPRNSV